MLSSINNYTRIRTTILLTNWKVYYQELGYARHNYDINESNTIQPKQYRIANSFL